MTTAKEGTLDWFLDEVASKNIQTMIDSDLHYLTFGIMGPVIELLGSLYDDEPFEEADMSSQRFYKAICEIQSLKKYRRRQHHLYNSMRSSMAHIGRPGAGVVLAQRSDATEDQHLKKLCFRGTKRVVLVCEDLHKDIVDAVFYVRADCSKKKDLGVPFMNPNLSPDTPPVPTPTPRTSG